MKKREYKVCSNCAMDTSDSLIVFDENGLNVLEQDNIQVKIKENEINNKVFGFFAILIYIMMLTTLV